MSTETPIVTKAVVELTFANGITRRLILDDKDATVALSLDVTKDIRETTPDDATWRSFEPGLRQRVDVHIVGRGPLQLDIPDPREAIGELEARLKVHRQRKSLILRELDDVSGMSSEAQSVAKLVAELLCMSGCDFCPPGCRFCAVDPECGCDVCTDAAVDQPVASSVVTQPAEES